MKASLIKLALLTIAGLAVFAITIAVSIATLHYGYGVPPKNIWAICGFGVLNWVTAFMFQGFALLIKELSK